MMLMMWICSWTAWRHSPKKPRISRPSALRSDLSGWKKMLFLKRIYTTLSPLLETSMAFCSPCSSTYFCSTSKRSVKSLISLGSPGVMVSPSPLFSRGASPSLSFLFSTIWVVAASGSLFMASINFSHFSAFTEDILNSSTKKVISRVTRSEYVFIHSLPPPPSSWDFLAMVPRLLS